MSNTKSKEVILKGISASPGICIGKAYLVGKEGVNVVKKYFVSKELVHDEMKRFEVAIKKSKSELNAIIKNTQDDLPKHTYILETHMLMLNDNILYGETLNVIEKELVNAEWALKKVVSNIKSTFQKMSDPYLRERVCDVVHVYDRIMRNLIGAKEINIADIDKRVILVANDLSPADTSQIQLEKIKGFITDRGGRTSHTSIIARTLEIPAVMGLVNATNVINNDDFIIVDGIDGSVIINPTEKTLLHFEKRKNQYEHHKAVVVRNSRLTATTLDGFQMQIMGNIELSEEVVSVLDHGGDGIGLYRTEFQYLSSSGFPSEDDLFDKYKDVVEVMGSKSVTIRTLDINGDKAINQTTDSEEINPALGLRAIRYCLKHPDIFKTQLKAILRAAAFGNVRILIPMISSYEEILDVKKLLNEAADSLDKQGAIFNRDIEIGVMIEVPSAVIMADVMAKAVDFFSIGTNDLIQYSLAIDRGNRDVAYLYNALHPAIIRMVKHVADEARNNGIKVFMCGEMAADPIHLPILLGIGMDELSMNPQSIPSVKSFIRLLNMENTQLFMKDVLKQNTTAQVMKLTQDTYGDALSEKLYFE